MNLDTVLMCARMAADKQHAALGFVDPQIQALIDELAPAPVEAEVEQVPLEEANEAVQEVEQVPQETGEQTDEA